MSEKVGMMTESIKELVAIGASVGAHCQPCLKFHIQAAVELGVSKEDIQAAVAVGHTIEKGAMSAMKKITTNALEDLLSATKQSGKRHTETATEQAARKTVLKIYDPAMCCSSGVCGPSVDPVLTQFAGALNLVASQPGIRVERYNLGQQPQAFVENSAVKSMLGNGGEKKLPFIFINDQLWIEGRYPEKSALLEVLKIENTPTFRSFTAPSENVPCCGDGGCC